MQAELVVPEVGESIREVEIGEWLKHEGDHVDKDEVVARLESDKATVEVVAPASGVLEKIVKQEGATAEIGEVIAYVGEEEAEREEPSESEAEPETEAERAEEEEAEEEPERAEAEPETSTEIELEVEPRVMPSARRALDEHEVRPEDVEATGPGGRVLEEDVERHVRERAAPASRGEKVVPMSPIRRRIAARLVEAQRNAALLTTFNEVDMSAVKALRAELGEAFREAHGVKLGLVSFFVKAVVEALRAIPEVGAEVRDGSLVTREACDVGIAVGGGKGLVVPVLRDADRMSFADIERTIADLARRAREGRLELSELQGGVFTISNGGIYGSLLSTPIVNPPQSGVLGMHAIQDRPVARDGRVEIRPMMYVALTYDHRVVDGREAVTFLRRIQDVVESPARLLLGI